MDDARNKAITSKIKRRHLQHIFYMWVKAIGPLLAIFSIFLGFTLKGRVTFQGKIQDLDGVMLIPDPDAEPSEDQQRYLYTSFQQSTILLLLGLLGLVGVSISALFMEIMAIWIADCWIKASKNNGSTEETACDLPTPLDLTLIIRIIDGGWWGFWTYIWLLKEGKWFGRIVRDFCGKKLQRQVRDVQMSKWGVHGPGVTLSLILIMGSGISLSGMSMHPKSRIVRLVTRYKVPIEDYSKFGRKLVDHCLIDDESDELPCSVSGNLKDIYPMGLYLRNASETFRTLKKELTRIHDIREYEDVTNGKYFYLTKADIPEGADYEVRSYALQTKCEIVAKNCLSEENHTTQHSTCIEHPIFDEMDSGKRFQLLISADSAGIKKALPTQVDNPYYLAVRAMRTGSKGPYLREVGDDGIDLWCKATVFNIQYTSVNNTITAWDTDMSNATLARIFAAPSFSDISNALLGEEMRAVYGPNKIDICQAFTRFYTWSAVAFVAGTMEEEKSLNEWARVETYGTRLPNNLLCALYLFVSGLTAISIILAVMAGIVTWGQGKDGYVWETKLKMTVEGAVAQALNQQGQGTEFEIEDVYDLFEEREKPGDGNGDNQRDLKRVKVTLDNTDLPKRVVLWELQRMQEV